MPLVIHRRSAVKPTWFEYNGEVYYAHRMGPYGSGDDCWDVYREHDIAVVGQFWRLADIRDLVAEGERQGWPDLIELDETNLADFTVRAAG